MRVAALDGWRGIAIALVLFDHIQDALLRHYARSWTQTGQHGVTIFFVLSGYLITSKLLEGPIDLKRFYLRRFFRLMPVAWAFLAVLVGLSCLPHVHLITMREVAACVFFYRNFDTTGRSAGHYWSLSVEEQFYLLWPYLLLLAGAKRSRWIAGAGTLCCAGYRWLYWAHYDNSVLSRQTQVRADALLVGCLLALFLGEPRVRAWLSRWSRALSLPAGLVVLGCIGWFHWLPPLAECLGIALLIGATVLHPATAGSRALAWRPLAWLGTVSYSVYVWQAFFMRPWSGWMGLLVFGVLMPAFALVSYYGIERPMVRFGDKVMQPHPQTAHAAALCESAG